MALVVIFTSSPFAFAGTTTTGSGGSGGGSGVRRSSAVTSPTVVKVTPAQRAGDTAGSTTTPTAVAPRASMAPAATMAVPSSAFRDVKTDPANSWAAEHVEALAKRGIINTSSNFRPAAPITRAELTKIALNAFGYTVDESVTESGFSDSNGGWYTPYMAAAKEAGILTKGNPNAPVNRAEALAILARAAGVDVNSISISSKPFPDVTTDAWYAKLVQWAKTNSVVGGYANGTFGADDTITRAAAAKIAANLLK